MIEVLVDKIITASLPWPLLGALPWAKPHPREGRLSCCHPHVTPEDAPTQAPSWEVPEVPKHMPLAATLYQDVPRVTSSLDKSRRTCVTKAFGCTVLCRAGGESQVHSHLAGATPGQGLLWEQLLGHKP